MSDQAIQLMHGDCLALMPLIPAGSVDMILTDLPYGTTACKWDSVIPFAPLWEAYRRVIKPNGAIVLFGSQPFTSALVISNAKMFRYELIWHKSRATGFLNAPKVPLKKHENIAVFCAGAPTYNPQMRAGLKHGRMSGYHKGNKAQVYNFTERGHPSVAEDFYPDTVNYFKCEAHPLHPTQKPVLLLEYLTRTYTNEGDTVLDSCMGSASTAIACMRTGRKFIGIERDDTYFEVSCQRVKDEQRQGRLFTV